MRDRVVKKAQDGICEWVRDPARRLPGKRSRLHPIGAWTLVAGLVAGACTPLLAPAIAGNSALVAAAIAQIGSLSGGLLAEKLTRVWDRLRGKRAEPITEEDIREVLTETLLGASTGEGSQQRQLRIDMATFLRNVNGASLAIEAAEGDLPLQQALARNFQWLGGAFQEFAWLLQDLVVRVDQGNARLDEIRAGQRATDQLIHGFWEDVRARLPRRRGRSAGLVVSGPPEDAAQGGEDLGELIAGPCPYPGLAAFGAEDAAAGFFRGRQDLTATVVARLAVQAGRTGLLMVLGPSGVGKSSLLRAGLLPAIAAGALMIERSEHWPQLYVHPDRDPVTELAVAISTLAGVSTAGLPMAIRRNPSAFRCAISQALASCGAERLVLVVDQFEELFTHGCTTEDQQAVIRALLLACWPASDGEPAPALVVLGMRADFYGHCARIPELAPILPGSQVLVGPMDDVELRDAIVEPAEAAGLALEPGLADLLLAEASGESLPLLAHSLRQTFEQRQGRLLTVEGYRSTGGIARAVASSAELVHAELDEAGRLVLRQVLLRMIHFGDGVEDTRRRVHLDELTGPDNRQQAVVERVLALLVRQRLVTADHDTYMLSHEALIHAWDRLDRWLSEDREGLRLHRELGNRARAWDRLGRDAGSLYGGAELELARRWTTSHPGQLDDLEQDFYQAGLAAQQSAQRSRRRRSRILVAVVISQAILLVAALLAGNVARQQSAIAIEERQSAEAAERMALSRQLAAQSASLAATNPNLAALLAVEAYRTAPSEAATSNLITAANLPLSRQLATRGSPYGMVFSPDGQTLAFTSANLVMNTHPVVRRWDVSTAKQINAIDPGPSFQSIDVSSNGRTLAIEVATNVGMQIRTWDLPTGKRIARISGLPGADPDVSLTFPQTSSISSDGSLIATRYSAGIQVWNARTGERVARLNSGNDPDGVQISANSRLLAARDSDDNTSLWDISKSRRIAVFPNIRVDPDRDRTPVEAFSPDGRAFVSANSIDTDVRLWNGRTGRLVSLPGHEDGATAVAFSPDSRTVATTRDDGLTRLWDVRSGTLLTKLPGSHDPRHTYDPYRYEADSIVFSPDGQTLATARVGDQQVRLWNARTGKPIAPLGGHSDGITALMFSPDGNTLATASSKQAARLWDSHTGQLLATLAGHPGTVESVVFSPDRRTIATADRESTIRFWDAQLGMRIATLTGHRGQVGRVLVTRDGRTLVSVGSDDELRFWDGQSGRSTGTRKGHSGSIAAAALSADGHTLATGGEDTTVRLWDLRSRQPTALFKGHQDGVTSLAVSADGRTVASGSWDHTARLWDVRSRKAIAVLGDHDSAVLAVAISPDGRTVATASNDHTARLWDAGTGKRMSVLRKHRDGVTAVAFSPDGRYVATGSKDGTAMLWDARTGRHLADLVGHKDAVTAIAFDPRGGTLLTASNDDTARLWDVGSHRRIATLSGHEGNVTAVAFSPDGRVIATGSADRSVRLWNGRTGYALTTMTGHRAGVSSLEFYPDGHTLATSGGDGTVRLWDAQVQPHALEAAICSAVGRSLTQQEWSFYLEGRTYKRTCDDK